MIARGRGGGQGTRRLAGTFTRAGTAEWACRSASGERGEVGLRQLRRRYSRNPSLPTSRPSYGQGMTCWLNMRARLVFPMVSAPKVTLRRRRAVCCTTFCISPCGKWLEVYLRSDQHCGMITLHTVSERWLTLGNSTVFRNLKRICEERGVSISSVERVLRNRNGYTIDKIDVYAEDDDLRLAAQFLGVPLSTVLEGVEAHRDLYIEAVFEESYDQLLAAGHRLLPREQARFRIRQAVEGKNFRQEGAPGTHGSSP